MRGVNVGGGSGGGGGGSYCLPRGRKALRTDLVYRRNFGLSKNLFV